jgi:DNA polymerase-3 subunit delta
MVSSRDDLRNGLLRGELLPVYVLFGPETHLLNLAVKTITNRAFADGDLRDFNDNVFSLNTDGNLRQAFAAAQQLPMMASRRVVRITDVRISASGFRDTITENDEPLITAYLADPSPSSVVIFVADELNGVRKMGKFLRDKAPAFEFSRLDDKQLANWAREGFKNANVQIDEAAFRGFMGRVDPDVRRVTNEINKLAAASMPSGIVSNELVEALVPHSRELDNFEITQHLVEGRRSKAVAALRKILDDGAEPLGLLGLIAYNYRTLLIAKDMMGRGADRREVMSVIRMPPHRHEAFLAAARRSDVSRLSKAIKRLAKADVDIKTSKGGSGPAGARLQIEMLVCELAVA